MSATKKDWPHAPVHRLDTSGVFMVTGATYGKVHLFKAPEHLTFLEGSLLALAKEFEWQLEAWAVFSNHYHFIARSLPESQDLKAMIHRLHTVTATELNRLQNFKGRKVWFNYWDTKLTFQKSYLARLNYVHQNPVKHGLVAVANQYEWCSACWFEQIATPAVVNTIYSFKTDSIKVLDEY